MITKNPEEVQFIQGWLADIPQDAPFGDRVLEEAAAIEFVSELDDQQTRRLAIDALVSAVKAPSEAFDNLVYGSQPLMEASPSKIPRLGERLLDGRNTALIIRANTYEDFGRDVVEPLRALRGFRQVEEEQFPRVGNGLGHSRVHLDRFFDGRRQPFPYDLTASRTDQGSVLFIAALANNSVRGWTRDFYEKVHGAVNGSNQMLGLRANATDRISPRGTSKEWNMNIRGVGGPFVATTLEQGDVVIWPQGGFASELPAWHGFYQIGHSDNPHSQPRKSTSFHFSNATLPSASLQHPSARSSE